MFSTGDTPWGVEVNAPFRGQLKSSQIPGAMLCKPQDSLNSRIKLWGRVKDLDPSDTLVFTLIGAPN